MFLLDFHLLFPATLLESNIAMGSADVDEQSKKEIKDILLAYDRTLLVADPRRCEPKKCGPRPYPFIYNPALFHALLLLTWPSLCMRVPASQCCSIVKADTSKQLVVVVVSSLMCSVCLGH